MATAHSNAVACYYCFTDGKTYTQRGAVTCPEAHSW